jgi:hypothetical protein
MKRVYGGLCIVAFISTIAACLSGPATIDARENHTSVSVTNSIPGDVETKGWRWWKKETRKAASLEIVVSKNCAPCRRLKVVAIRLLAEGYDVTIIKKKDDERNTKAYPTLYYLNAKGWVIKKETGFKTRDHIVKYLGKGK